ncbi:hypothetical protein DV711_13255 [Motiliproteus coralliicola]|uniref:Uncharacterized protein n=1 Tax=Motiliproteus coralliicola TaxID=2283196 RepID=A0A369WEV8_9GAMM|nr:hypothetical protein DV711_13255 [Motiliproteus coralliicola]
MELVRNHGLSVVKGLDRSAFQCFHYNSCALKAAVSFNYRLKLFQGDRGYTGVGGFCFNALNDNRTERVIRIPDKPEPFDEALYE